MGAPTVSTDFQIGIDNAMIQVPQNYTVPSNPPSMPNPPSGVGIVTNTATTTTKDTVTVYLSAIKGFNSGVTLSFFIRRIDSTVDPALPPADATTAPADQILIGSTSSDWVSGTYDPIRNGWGASLPFTLAPNVHNALNYYAATNYKTLWINPQGTGGAIDPNHPPSYQVNLYALDVGTNTYTACSFTLVVLPSVNNYGLGVFGKVKDPVTGQFYFANSVAIPRNSFGSGTGVDVVYNFYPLEPEGTAPANVIVGLFDFFNDDSLDAGIIDATNSTITSTGFGPTPFASYLSDGVVTSGFTRDTPSDPVTLHIELNGNGNQNSTDPYLTHALIRLRGIDTNGVSVTAYLIVQVVGHP
jgi:hypothetical protein